MSQLNVLNSNVEEKVEDGKQQPQQLSEAEAGDQRSASAADDGQGRREGVDKEPYAAIASADVQDKIKITLEPVTAAVSAGSASAGSSPSGQYDSDAFATTNPPPPRLKVDSIEPIEPLPQPTPDSIKPTVTLKPSMIGHGQRPNSANATDKGTHHHQVFFGDDAELPCAFATTNALRQQQQKSPDQQRGHNQQLYHQQSKMVRNFSVESGGSTGTAASHKQQRLRKSRSRSSFKAPDGGWGWVIVFASFVISMIADGISFSFGIFFVDLSNYFGASKSKTAFVGSLFLSMPLLIGPLASALTDRFGCRWVTILSGLLAAGGFILGYFAYTLEHLFIAFSISGAGLALSYVTSIVIVAYYFERRRSLATGLAVCGTGFGTTVFAPVTTYLLEYYSWRGTMLIMAGFFLNIVVCGALMRDLPEMEEDGLSDRSCDFDSDNYVSETERMPSCQQRGSENGGSTQPHHHHHQHHHLTPPEGSAGEPDGAGGLSVAKSRLFSSLVHIPTYITHRGSLSDPQEVINELTQRKDGYLSQLIQRYPQVLTSFFFGQRDLPRNLQQQATGNRRADGLATVAEKKPLTTTSPRDGSSTRDSSSNNNTKSPESGGGTVRSPRTRPSMVPNYRLNSLIPELGGGSHLRNLKLQRGSISYRSAMLNIRKYRLRASSCPDIYRNSTISGESSQDRNCFGDVKDVCDLIDFSIFRCCKYTLFCISNLLLYMCIDVPYVYLPDHAIDTGSSEKETSSFLISVIGIVNTAGIVVCGWLGDRPWIEPSMLYSCFIACSGLSIGLIPWIHDYIGLATLAALYGFTISANYALVSVILVDLISLDKFTNGYGLLLLVQGIASLIGPPFAGFLYDLTGSYDCTFYVTGLLIFVSGAIVIPVGGSDKNCTAMLLTAKERVAKGALAGAKGATSPAKAQKVTPMDTENGQAQCAAPLLGTTIGQDG